VTRSRAALQAWKVVRRLDGVKDRLRRPPAALRAVLDPAEPPHLATARERCFEEVLCEDSFSGDQLKMQRQELPQEVQDSG
jgi:hypothetical protein